MKLIQMWLVMTIWLAMHQSVNDRAAEAEDAAAREKNEIRATAVCAGMYSGKERRLAVGTALAEEKETGRGVMAAALTENKETECEDVETEGSGYEDETAKATEEGSGDVTESEPVTENGMEKDSEFGTETETGSGSEMTEESETETEDGEEAKKILVIGLYAAYENGTKIYDGTTYVRMEAVAEGLPEGIELLAWGETEEAHVGEWEVTPFFSLTGEGADEYELCMETECPTVTVVPRPLKIEISDAEKYYYAENSLTALRPLAQDGELVRVSGFLEEETPEGFRLPELAIDGDILKKSSPMYEDGARKEYKGAVIVKTRADGSPTGNPTADYCFVLDPESGYYKAGSVFLEEPPIVGTLDYRLSSPAAGAMYRDEGGILWVRSGTVIVIEPQEGSGFTEKVVTSALYESSSVGFVLQKRSKEGEITAKSQMQQFTFCVDAKGPTGTFLIDGGQEQQGIRYSRENVTVRIAEAADDKSGLCSVKLYAGRDMTGAEDMEQLYQSTAQHWGEGWELTLTEEGCFCVCARLEDRVGNTAYFMVGQICIDRTPPQLEISQILNQSANNGKVAPVVSCTDLYYETGSLEVALTGSRVGEKKFAQKREALPEGETVSVGDIPREKRWDDLYVLCASARDKAGNYTEKKVAFSVNRFGSVFQTDEKVRRKLERYYLQSPVDLVIREFNIDTISRVTIYMGYGEQVRALEPGKEYFVAYSGREQGWQQYQYRIPAKNFRQEGTYYIVIVTKDRAGNTADNRVRRQRLEFAVDRTPPSVIVAGIEDGGIYRENRMVEIECRDNILLDSAEVYLNDMLVVQNRQENQKITLTPSKKWQKLVVRAADGAGNIGLSNEIWTYLGDPLQAQTALPEAVKREAEQEQEEIQENAKKEEEEKEAGVKTKETADVMAEEKTAAGSKEAPYGESAGSKKMRTAPKTGAAMIAGMAFFPLLGVYFYKNKRAK